MPPAVTKAIEGREGRLEQGAGPLPRPACALSWSSMEVFEVWQRRTPGDPLVRAGSIKAPDLELALLLARETHFRHHEGAECWVAHRGRMHAVAHPETMGGVTDRSYRRQDGYVGVGARHKKLSEALRARGLTVDAPRPGARGG